MSLRYEKVNPDNLELAVNIRNAANMVVTLFATLIKKR